MPLHPQVEQLLALMVEAQGGTPPPAFETQTVAQNREMIRGMSELAGPPAEVATVTDLAIPGPAGDIPARMYTPEGEGPFPVLVWYHGGGWVIGDLESADGPARKLAAQSGSLVVSVDYRLAPEHTFPAAVDDSYAAAVWAAEKIGDHGGDPTRLAVGGDSAGGNLAAVVAQLAKAAGGPAIAYQLLVYPATDQTETGGSMIENADAPILTKGAMDWFYGHYLNGPADGDDPRVSPLKTEDLSGLPPAMVITAEFDPLRDQGKAYADRLAAAGVPVEYVPCAGMIHGFFQMGAVLDTAKEIMDRSTAALRAALT